LQRPTHRNTSWDLAKFEVCCHRWIDLSEYGFGVAILNDSKYGCATLGNTISLSLLRSPKAPDSTADIGTHQFKYSILPHKSSFQEAGVIREAYNLNVPLFVRDGSSHVSDSFFEVSGTDAVILDTIKKAEDSNNVILRLYESFGGKARANIRSPLNVEQVSIVNILEESVQGTPALKWEHGGVVVDFTPFQVLTISLKIQ